IAQLLEDQVAAGHALAALETAFKLGRQQRPRLRAELSQESTQFLGRATVDGHAGHHTGLSFAPRDSRLDLKNSFNLRAKLPFSRRPGGPRAAQDCGKTAQSACQETGFQPPSLLRQAVPRAVCGRPSM